MKCARFPLLLSLITSPLLSLGLLFSASPSFAEKSDRDQPVNLEADRVTIDDRKRTQTFEGRVTLSQGSFSIRAEKLVVMQDDDGYQKGVAYGSDKEPARFRQKREATDEWVTGEASRIEHDAKTEKTRLYDNAHIRSGEDEVRGQFIEYDSLTENYMATSGRNATIARPGSGPDSRVRAVIQPKRKNSSASGSGGTASSIPSARLRSADELGSPPKTND